MRTKRFIFRSSSRWLLSPAIRCGAADSRLYFTHATLHFCIEMTPLRYEIHCSPPVPSTGYKPVPRRFRRHPALASQEFSHGFSPGSDLEFLINPPDVGVDGLVADAEFLGDFLVEKTLREAVEDLLFPG